MKVLDFGFSKSSSDEDAESSLTGPAEMIGSPRYMSPEQVRGDDVDHRADIWALGVILYRFLSGAAPFGGKGKGISGALTSIVMDNPQPLAELVPVTCPRASTRSCSVASRSRRTAAPHRPRSLAARLAPFASGEGRAAVARLIRSVEGQLLAEVATNPPPKESRLARLFAVPQRRLLLGGIVAAPVAVSAVAFALLGHKASQPSADTATSTSTPTTTTTPIATSTVTATSPPTLTVTDPPAVLAAASQPPGRRAQPAARPSQHARSVSNQAGASSTSVHAAAIDDRY